jgi:hypothetical protein
VNVAPTPNPAVAAQARYAPVFNAFGGAENQPTITPSADGTALSVVFPQDGPNYVAARLFNSSVDGVKLQFSSGPGPKLGAVPDAENAARLINQLHLPGVQGAYFANGPKAPGEAPWIDVWTTDADSTALYQKLLAPQYDGAKTYAGVYTPDPRDPDAPANPPVTV